jgi:hypothetical protein
LPSLRISLKALRSIASAMARRTRASSNGALSRLISRLAWVLVACCSQMACGACSLASRANAMVTMAVKVMSTLPDVKASIAVERLAMMLNSSPSR